MNFSVIVSIDTPADIDVEDYLRGLPPLDETEDDDQYDYDYLGGCWENGHHRKVVGILTRPEFDQLVRALGLKMQDIETGGSIGAPGFGIGWAPAFSFTAAAYEAIIDAYVTPIPNVPPPEHGDDERLERAWERIKKAMLAVYS